MSDPFRIDAARMRRSFGRSARSYDAAAILQQRVCDELLERLDFVRLEPATVLDLGAGTGRASRVLKQRYRPSQVVAMDLAEGMLREAGRHLSLWRRFRRVCGNAAALPLRDASVDIVFSNLMLQWCNDPDAVFRECRRVLRPGGLLTFTTLGPDTLVELRRAWAAADGHTHVNRFLDMHDLGDSLVRSGLADPVLDVERYTLTYAEAGELMRDLKAIGARNANAGRPRGLTGKRALAAMVAAYESDRRDGRLPATYEVVYGQAWCPIERPRGPAAQGEVRVPLDRIGRRRG